MENRDYDFVNNWVDVTVENEVWRGKKLREVKPIPIKIKDDYDVINIDYIDPLCNGKRQRRRYVILDVSSAYCSTYPTYRSFYS